MNKIFTFMRESGPARFFIPVGIILTIFGVVMLVISIQNQDYIETESIVSNIELYQEAYTDTDGHYNEATYDITVKYTVDGKEYEGVIPNYHKQEIGDKMKIYYNPEDPSKITQTKSIVLPIAIICGGIAAFIGGLVSAINAVKRHKKMKEQERSWNNAQ